MFTHHFLVILVGEFEDGLDGFKLVENFVVPGHVCRQNAPVETLVSASAGVEEGTEDICRSLT